MSVTVLVRLGNNNYKDSYTNVTSIWVYEIKVLTHQKCLFDNDVLIIHGFDILKFDTLFV